MLLPQQLRVRTCWLSQSGALLSIASALLAVSSCETPSSTERRAPDGGSRADAGDQGDSGGGYEMVGVYRCCAPGTGTSCCEGVDAGMCFQHGGIYGDCIGEGEVFEAKVICSRCCDGLTRVPDFRPGDASPPEVDGLPEGCDGFGDSAFVCLRCGDGVCGIGETHCNCPEDCN